MLTLESRRLRIRFDRETGAVRELFDKKLRKEYALPLGADAFRLERSGGATSRFERCAHSISVSPEGETTIGFEWTVSDGLTVRGSAAASPRADDIRFVASVLNDAEEPVVGLEYPIVPNLRTVSDDGADDYVAHSFATGLLVRDPMKHFDGEVGLRHMPYPESFSGASMQWFAYYGEGRGGLYFATYDGEMHPKWLNFYKNENGLLEASFFHAAESIAPRTGLTVPYPVVVQALDGDGWYEAAELYKQWAVRQPWCRQGPLSERPEERRARWLYEETGACTFGINAGCDRSEWIREYHRYVETPMFHVLGPDWVHRTQNFYNGVPGGMDDWFPTRFHPANLEAMKRLGDKFAPFEFDYLFGLNGADAECGRRALQRFPEERALRSIDKYAFPLVCPAEPYVRELHVRRDERLQEEADVDSIYYDISANNILKACMDESHGHPVGAGRRIATAYRDNYAATKEAMIANSGRYIPMGTEMMNEAYLDVLDYYQARAGARPAAPLEMYNFKSLLMSGEAQLIPMFAYVYHEYGALRMDGWGKLTEEIGDLFYFTAARTYLWGGLYELNYEYSPMEAIDGKENAPEEHYYLFEPRGYALSPERARYLGMLARVRVGPGNKYLAYGKMVRPLPFGQERARFSWFHYNCDENFPEYEESGEYEAEAIVHAAWRYRDEGIAYFFANVTNEAREVEFELDARRFGLPAETYRVRRIDGDSVEDDFALPASGSRVVRLALPPKSVRVVEVIPEGTGTSET